MGGTDSTQMRGERYLMLRYSKGGTQGIREGQTPPVEGELPRAQEEEGQMGGGMDCLLYKMRVRATLC